MTDNATPETLIALVDATAPQDLPTLAGKLATAHARVMARITTELTTNKTQSHEAPADGLLTVHDAAKRLGVQPTWLYRNAKDLPFTRKLSHRTLRFDAKGLDRWAKARATAA